MLSSFGLTDLTSSLSFTPGSIFGLVIQTIDGKPVSVNTVTTDTTPTITGVVMGGNVSGITITFKLPNDTVDGTTITNIKGEWSYTYTNEIPVGTFNISDLVSAVIPLGPQIIDNITVDDAIQFIGSAQGSATSPPTLPTHTTNDLIIAIAFRDGGEVGATPAGWTEISSGPQSAWRLRVYKKTAQSNTENLSGFLNAPILVGLVYRGANNSSPLGSTTSVTGGTGLLSSPNITFQNTENTSWGIVIVYSRANNSPAGTMPGLTLREAREDATTTSGIRVWDTNGPVNTIQPNSVNTGGQSMGIIQLELKSHA